MIRNTLLYIALLFSLADIALAGKESSFPLLNNNSSIQEIIVDHVFPNSPAMRGGLKSRDQIIKVDGEVFFSRNDFTDILKKLVEGKKTIFTVLRKNRKVEIPIIPRKGRYRLGVSFKIRDSEIAQQLKFKIWPDYVSLNYRKFSIFFQMASSMNRNSRSPQIQVLQHVKELLLNKGYIFTDNQEHADFIVEAEFKKPKKKPIFNMNQKKKTDTHTKTKKRRLIPLNLVATNGVLPFGKAVRSKKIPFDAFRIIFRDPMDKKPFLKVSGRLNKEKAKKYGTKNHVYSMIDIMLEKFPIYSSNKEPINSYANSGK